MKLSANHSIRYFDQLLRRLWSTGSKTTILHATAVTLLSLAAVLRAELSVIESLEWKTMDSPLVVRGRIIAGEEVTPKTSRYDAALTIAVTEVLKGSAKETSMEFYPKEDSEIVQEWIKSGHDYLFFSALPLLIAMIGKSPGSGCCADCVVPSLTWETREVLTVPR